jgi:sugar phosphate permease
MNAVNLTVKEQQTTSLVYVGWLAVALFYFYQYILRVAPGVLVTDLRQTFHLTAEQFATLGAFYLYAYSLCQIPLGMIVDYIGVRKTVIASILMCLTGTLLLAYSPSLSILQFSRILVGIGSACAFMCTLKVIIDYLPVGKRGFLMGATLTLGTLGAIVAGKPLANLADQVGWRLTITYTACFGLIILLFTILFLPRPRKELLTPVSSHLTQSISTSLIEIVKTRTIIIYSILAIGVYTPLSGLADLWGVAFLMQKYNLARTQAAEISMMMYFGLGLGCLILPWLSEKYHFLNRSIQICAFGVLAVFALLLYGPSLSIFSLKMSLILLGIFCGVEMLCFAGASRYTHARNVGTTLGVVNTLNMLGGGALQQLIGWCLDRLWAGKIDAAGIRIYHTSEYTIALSLLFIVVLICCFMSFCLPKDETNGRV